MQIHVLLAFLLLASQGLVAAPSCSGASQVAQAIAADDFRLSHMTVTIADGDVCAQTEKYGSKVPLSEVVRAALMSFLQDGNDDESPLALTRDLARDELNMGHEPTAQAVEKRAHEILRSYLNRTSTELALVTEENPPEGGESVSDAWIFSLYIPDLSDHGHWVIIDRAAEKKTYNYGFN